MSAFNSLLEKARANKRNILLPESTDDRILLAAIEAADAGIAQPVLIGEPDTLNARAQNLNVNLDAVAIVDHKTSDKRQRLTELLVERRAHRGMTVDKAKREIDNPLVFACMMLVANEADGCVAGAITPTADVVRYAMQLVGKRENVNEVSSFFIMLMRPDHPVKDAMVIADCALVIDPDAESLASIAASTGDSALQLLGMEPQIAMLSFSTNGSARHKTVTKVANATALLRDSRPRWRVVGEVQLDAAVIPRILASKAPDQATDEPCNTLIFPNLDAGNIGYKLIERFGGAEAIGPILQGLNKPLNDLSRGCKQSDIVNLIATTAVQAG